MIIAMLLVHGVLSYVVYWLQQCVEVNTEAGVICLAICWSHPQCILCDECSCDGRWESMECVCVCVCVRAVYLYVRACQSLSVKRAAVGATFDPSFKP